MLPGREVIGEVEIGGMTARVEAGELMLFVPGAEGFSEFIDWDTATRLLFLLKLVILHAKEAR